MHDTLKYFQHDPIHRKYHHNQLTFSMLYAFTENFVLPLSHDEVVHGKGSLIGKMPGDEWQQFANLRLLFGYMWAHPGKKLLFMGGEFGQRREWKHDESLEWHVLAVPAARRRAALGARSESRSTASSPALYAQRLHDRRLRVDRLQRRRRRACCRSCARAPAPDDVVLVVCNFTPVPRDNYRVGVPRGGVLARAPQQRRARSTAAAASATSAAVEAAPIAAHGRLHSLTLRLPPLAALYLTPAGQDDARRGSSSRTSRRRSTAAVSGQAHRGDTVIVEADVFADGHDIVTCTCCSIVTASPNGSACR